ncbi:MAG: hypothetical protein ABI697_11155, partial [Devosia sp.]
MNFIEPSSPPTVLASPTPRAPKSIKPRSPTIADNIPALADVHAPLALLLRKRADLWDKKNVLLGERNAIYVRLRDQSQERSGVPVVDGKASTDRAERVAQLLGEILPKDTTKPATP